MENPQENKEKKLHKTNQSLVWDCGSTLYDSFELNSLKRQLDSAISTSRTLSMPHHLPADKRQSVQMNKKSSSKISRSIQKLLRSIFRQKPNFRGGREDNGFYVYYDKEGALSTIPEGPEFESCGVFSPEINSLVRKTASERFSASIIGISCA